MIVALTSSSAGVMKMIEECEFRSNDLILVLADPTGTGKGVATVHRKNRSVTSAVYTFIFIVYS